MSKLSVPMVSDEKSEASDTEVPLCVRSHCILAACGKLGY